MAMLGFLCQSVALPAAEPYERFLARMREERLFDLALVYLEDIEKRPDVEAEFKQVMDLERALLYSQAASYLPRNSPQRAEKLNQTEASLKRFLEGNPNHIRRSEARLKLGGLLQMRAEEALGQAEAATGGGATGGGAGERDVPEAIEFFHQAHLLYESTIAELAEIEASLRGGRVDANDPKQIAYRDRVVAELREAQLLSAKAVENRGRSRSSSNPERLSDLQQARKMFADLYAKAKSLIAIGTYALFYRSGIDQLLGQPDDAIDGYQRVVDLEGIDVLRPLQTEAVTELAKVLASEGKYQVALERAKKWIDGLRNDEKASNEAIMLSLEYAKIRITQIEKLRAENSSDRNAMREAREVREELRGMLRSAGGYQDQVRSLLGRLGVESGQSSAPGDKLPEVKNLKEALEASQQLMDDADAISVSLEAIEERLAGGKELPQEVDQLQQQKSELQSQVDQLRQQSLQLIRNGLALFDRAQDDRADLFKARRQMAYLLSQLGNPREAIIVGEFLSRTSPATVQGLNAARIVLNGYSELIKDPQADQLATMRELAPFAEFLVANWPDSAEAATVSLALIQLAVLSKDWEAAERYLQIVPESDPGIARYYFELGAALFDQYQNALKDASISPEVLEQFRERALKWLQLAASRADPQDLNLRLSVHSAVAQMLLSQDRVEEAAKWLLSDEKSPLRALESRADQVSQDAAMDACRTGMRIVAASVSQGTMPAPQAALAMQQYLSQLQKQAERSDDGQQKLQGVLASIARDMKDKLSLIQEPQRKAQAAEVALLVMSEAAKSPAFATQYWAASSLLAIAEELESKAAYNQAADLLSQMNQTAAKQPGWAQPEGVATQLKVMLARAADGAGDFRTALLTYGQILDDNENLLDVQIDVARLLQKIGTANPARLTSAIQGGKPNPKTGKNAFWGWGKISQMTSRRLEDYSAQFFESRYQLAYCRWLMAVAEKEPNAKNAELARAERVLMETHSLYPQLGSPENIKRYDGLMKKIQVELGKPAVGFPGGG